MKPFNEYYGIKKKNNEAVLTAYEKKVVSALKNHNVRDQDITYILNIGRKTTLNHARIGAVKKSDPMLTDEELKQFEQKQMAWDFQTGLNPIENDIDCLLIKSKNAMIQSVTSFNSPANNFSMESFLILANVAWLYLFQAFCLKYGINYTNTDRTTQALSYMIESNKAFLTKANIKDAIIKNIEFIIKLRDFVSHDGLQRMPSSVITKLQANCINYNNVIKQMFDDRNGLDNIFSIALQFASISLSQSKSIIKNSTSKNILNFVSEFEKNINDDILDSEEYQFTVTYIAINEGNKNQADIVRFIVPGSEGYEEKKEILIKEISEDARYKYMFNDIKEKSHKTKNQILDFIKKKKFRDLKKGISNNKQMMKPYIFGKTTQWKYTEEFLQLCINEIA
ncbi:MAG: hypothetical protein E7016_03025 [Alphaproteobacteria bacterium]|nr:hypothetical protein [Alphaproteobacteria bacterium]